MFFVVFEKVALAIAYNIHEFNFQAISHLLRFSVPQSLKFFFHATGKLSLRESLKVSKSFRFG